MPVFPSVSWFQEAAALLNASDSFKQFGSTDCEMGVQAGDKYYEIDFEAFAITRVAEIDAARAGELDFVLVQSMEKWQAMLQDIKTHGRATHEYTLNSLDLNTAEEFARGKDYHRRDAFYRFNQTFQDYFDQSTKMETTFAPEAVAAG